MKSQREKLFAELRSNKIIRIVIKATYRFPNGDLNIHDLYGTTDTTNDLDFCSRKSTTIHTARVCIQTRYVVEL